MLTVEQTDRYERWYRRLRDPMAKAMVARQADRIARAGEYVGDWKPVGDGVMESRMDYGPGYRLYSSIEGGVMLLLLAGGDKSTQARDIADAKATLGEWRLKRREAGSA